MKQRITTISHIPYLLFFTAWLTLFPSVIYAQCSDWAISITNVQPSNCAASGSFNVGLSGSSVANFNNIRYSILTTASGFSVPPNSSPNFVNIPAGSYTVQVTANCSGTTVSQSATVTVGGAYVSPSLIATEQRASLSCGNYGQILLSISGSSTPYSIKVIAAPSGYTGGNSISTNSNSYVMDNLPGGNYQLQIEDACGTATGIQTITVNAYDPTTVPFYYSSLYSSLTSCNIIYAPIPSCNSSEWQNLMPLYQVAASLDGGVTLTPFQPLNTYNALTLTLPAGKTYKDYYNQSMTYVIKPPCGNSFKYDQTFWPFNISLSQTAFCNGFQENISASSNACFPVTFVINGNGVNLTYTATDTYGFTTATLPFGSYTLTYSTSDGTTGTLPIGDGSVAQPYTMGVNMDADGLNGYIGGFFFYKANGNFMPGTRLQLVSGPAGYAYDDYVYSGTNSYEATYNMAAVINNDLYFKPGNYQWRITDSCNSYLLNYTVTDSAVYHYTLDVSHQKQTCDGLLVYPQGTVTQTGNPWVEAQYQLLQAPAGAVATMATTGSLLLQIPGTYVIGIGANSWLQGYGTYPNPFPNPYQVTQTIVYDPQPLAVDINNTQGFLCIGSSSSQGQIVVKGMGGTPFYAPSTHYKYSLAAAGNGLTGPYLAQNTTGTFPGLGGANTSYDVKIADTCGAYVVQNIQILDLSTAVLATANADTLCANDSLQLTAIPMPQATYSWTGPNGFTSTQRVPVIYPLSVADSGIYTVTIATPFCTVPAAYHLHVAVNPSPDAPILSVTCTDTAAILSASYLPGVVYQWDVNHTPIPGATDTIYIPTTPGIYTVYTVFSNNGCKTPSQSMAFTSLPGHDPQVLANATNPSLCKGDSTLLYVTAGAQPLSYQWYRNGVAIPNATDSTSFASDSGYYSVQITTGPCTQIMSDTIHITQPIPDAYIRPLTSPTFCDGDSVTLVADTGTQYSFAWSHNGAPLQNAVGNSYVATTKGDYTVTVNNGVCSNTSNSVTVKVNPVPVADINPSGNNTICNGSALALSTPFDPTFTYTWLYNGDTVPGATGDSLLAVAAGNYLVVAGNGVCPNDTSKTLALAVVPRPGAVITPDGPTRFCTGGKVALNANTGNNFIYSWFQEDALLSNAGSSSYTATATGSYTAVVSNGVCADTAAPIVVTVDALPIPEISRMDLQLNTGSYTAYQWYYNTQPLAGANGQYYTIAQPGYYAVSVTDDHGCMGLSDSLFVASLTEACMVRFPSAFTPNNDSKNDLFRVIGADAYKIHEFAVFNRWGQMVFETVDGTRGWDGTFGGVPQPADTYFYYIKYKCNDGSQLLERRGDVTLVR